MNDTRWARVTHKYERSIVVHSTTKVRRSTRFVRTLDYPCIEAKRQTLALHKLTRNIENLQRVMHTPLRAHNEP